MHPGSGAGPGRVRARAGAVAGMIGVLAVGAAARLWHWREIYTADGVLLAYDSDAHYHLLQAERFLRSGLDPLWFDPNLNWPFGAPVPWPPLFDVLVAFAARLAFGAAPARGELAAAAALVPVALALLTLLAVAALGRMLGGRNGGLGAALILALLMAHVMTSSVGRVDQHVLEVLLSTTTLLAFVLAWRSETRVRRAVATTAFAITVTLAFWNWMGSALNLVLPAGFTAVVVVFLDEETEVARRVPRVLALGLALAAALLALGAPGTLGSGTLLGLSGTHVCITACGAGFGALLVLARRLRSGPARLPRRLLEVALSALVPIVVALAAFPPVREGMRTGLTALGAGNPWYASILEFQHLILSCHYPLAADVQVALMAFGLTIPAALVAVPSLVRRWRAGERIEVLFLASWGVLYLVLVLARRRFAPYAAVPLAVLAWEGIRYGAAAAGERLRLGSGGRIATTVLATALVVAPSARDIPDVFMVSPPASRASALGWLSAQPAPDGREGVLSNWTLGHLVAYYAGKPVVATPFGTEGGPDALLDSARFGFEADPAAAEGLLLRRRIGYIVLEDPRYEAHLDGALAAPGNAIALSACNYRQGLVLSFAEAYGDLMYPRLFLFDGLSAPGRPALPIPWARLVHDSGGGGDRLKIFGVVPGARLRVSGARPMQPVEANVSLVTNQGRTLPWRTGAIADATGNVELRVPYASGANGAVQATRWIVADGAAELAFEVSEDAVMGGQVIEVDLRSGQARQPVTAAP